MTAPIPELPASLVDALQGLAARDASPNGDDPVMTLESVLSALYVRWPSIRKEVLGSVPVRRELDLRRRQMARFPFCPDHRDKVLGKPCRECEVERLGAEVQRLHAWLKLIDGGDNPCRDEDQLRTWAYEATTLGRQAPGGQS